jgi:uncharacterized protein YciI
MLYAIIGRDAPDALAKRRVVRPAHLERIGALVQSGRMVLAGPLPATDSPDPGPAGFAGSLIVAEFESLEAARSWIDADPYVTDGVFASVEVHPFVKVAP